MDTKKLKQKILDLAIHGKLVPQDPNDEPASALLTRIREEKLRLIKEGKIKKAKKSDTSDTSRYGNVPFDVPDGWVWCTLGEIISIKSGDLLKVRDNQSGKYPVYGGNGIAGYYDNYNIDSDTIVIGRVGFYCGSIHLVTEKAWITDNAFITTIADKDFDVTFLKYLLIHLNLKDASNSTAQPVISGKSIYPIPVPLPPLAEQHRIVAEIEKWFTLIDTIESSKTDLQTSIKQAKSKILDLAIRGKLVPQDPHDEPASELLKRINPKAQIATDNAHYGKVAFEVPDNWEWQSHNEILEISGGAQPAKNYFSPTPKAGYIRLYQIRDYGDNPIPIYIPEESATKRTKKGDILLARYGGSLGKVFRANEGAYNVAMAKVIVKYEGLINSDFLYIYYISSLYQKKLKEISRTAQAGFNSGDFADLLFPLPPLAEQSRIVAKVEELFAQLDKIAENL